MNARFLKLVLLILCPVFLAQSAEAQKSNVDTLIVGGHRFETDSKSFVPNTSIAVKDGKLLEFDKPAEQYAAKSTIKLGDNQYVLPGLVDCHAHYNVKLFKKRREEFEVMPIIYLANGATTTFSCGEYAPEKMNDLRKRIESGKQVGPNLITSGPYFGWARKSWRGEKSADQIREEVDFWARQGAGGFKAKGIDPDSLKVLIEQAHKHGLTVTGHLGSGFRNSVNPRDAIDMGIDRIEHFIGGDAMPDSKNAYAVLGRITADMPEYKKGGRAFQKQQRIF